MRLLVFFKKLFFVLSLKYNIRHNGPFSFLKVRRVIFCILNLPIYADFEGTWAYRNWISIFFWGGGVPKFGHKARSNKKTWSYIQYIPWSFSHKKLNKILKLLHWLYVLPFYYTGIVKNTFVI